MLYFLIRPLVRITLRIFFSKIHLHGLERIPLDRPVLISSNHPSAFLEACVLATHFPRPLHFLVRGDIFINKWIIRLLQQVHLIPIYRSIDGFKNLRANESTFNECHRRLRHNEIIVVYSEGSTIQEKRLRPIQKGLARIAFGALDKHPDLNLCIVPLGVNYTHPNDFRSEIMIEVGEPIDLKPYVASYAAEPIAAVLDLTQRVEQAMKPLVIHIDRDEDLPLAETCFLIHKSRARFPFWPVVDRSGDRFPLDKKIADEINVMPADQKEKWQHQLAQLQLPAEAPRMFSIVAWLGKWANALPLWLGYKIAKSKVTRIEFFASVLIGVCMFSYLFYLLVVALIAFLLSIPFWQVWGFLFLTGMLYLYHRHQLERIRLQEIHSLSREIQFFG
jgi:1-acyl-sn-glycerol-3-phosphate acyltransferase